MATEHSVEKPARGNLQRLVSKVLDDHGLDLAQYRPRYVERRVAVRLNLLGVHTYQQYAAYLDQHPEEYAKLLDALTINVTQFFRDESVFRYLREKIVPEILASKERRKQHIIRVWSAGCATGEEAYSLAMSFLDGMRGSSREEHLTVVATDIDPEALAVAKRGVYPAQHLNQVPAIYRGRYIETDGDVFRIAPHVARTVRFQVVNLFEDTPINGVDLVFCRNVFIYFNREDQERMIRGFRQALFRGGYLVLGRSERLSPPLAREFELVSARERVYRKPLV